MASSRRIRLIAALVCGAALAAAQRPERANYTIVDQPRAEKIARAQYRVTNTASFTLVTVFAGEKPTGGYSVEIAGVERVAGKCIVRYRIEPPPPDAIVTQALTYPATGVRITPACRDVAVDPPLPRAEPK